MRGAIVFSGRINCWRDCYENYIKCFRGPLNTICDLDVFATLNEENQYSEEEINEFISHYEVKKLIVVNSKQAEMNYIHIPRVPETFSSSFRMLYYWKRNLELIQSSQHKYDFIVSARADIVFEDTLNLTYINNMQSNTFYKPDHSNNRGYCDQLYFGDSKVMEQCLSMYDSIPLILEQTREDYNPELYLKFWIDINQINVQDILLNFNLHPDRQR